MQAILSSYYLPVQTAAVIFPLIALVITLPYAVYSYRRYGAISLWRTIVFFSMIFYVQTAYYLTILPLPDPQTLASEPTITPQLVPFSFVADFLHKSGFVATNPATWPRSLITRVAMEPLFNIALVLPWGVYLTYYYKARFRTVLLLSFALTLFFEVSQLTGLFGLYPKAYRLFDVDDLMLNTLGGCLGYLIMSRLMRIRALPARDAADERSRRRSAQVSYLRRSVAFLIDLLIIVILDMALAFTLEAAAPTWAAASEAYLLPACFGLYGLILPLLWKGKTVGKALVRIHIAVYKTGKAAGKDHPPRPFVLALVIRFLLRNAVIFLLLAINSLINTVEYNAYPLLVALAIVALVILDMLINLRHGRLLLYERLSHTRNESSYPLIDPPSPIEITED